ncbi:MAG: DUF4912 domain-containing protein [Candidatus Tantalella remota]|nr:DUF4912 domain-containing protein [Candidatus Tantalella remota]
MGNSDAVKDTNRNEDAEATSQSPEANVCPARVFDIPQSYGDNRITLMVRDPWTVYSYWEISKDVEGGVRGQIERDGLTVSKSVLRVSEVSGEGDDSEEKKAFEITLKDWADSWYLHVGDPGKKWVAEVGIVCETGEFFCLAKSNPVSTPTNSMSDVCDGDWMGSDLLYYKMLSYGLGESSFEVREQVDSHLRKWLFSGGMTSGMFGRESLDGGKE